MPQKHKKIPLPIRTLVYTANKWIPNIIPIEEIPDLEQAFERLSKKHKINENDRIPDFIFARNKAIFNFSFYLGLRPLEVVRIRFADFLRNKEGEYYLKIRPENNKRKKGRMLPLPDNLVMILTELLMSFDYRHFWKDSEWLFPSTQNKGNHLSRYQWNDIFQKAIREAGLWRPHPTKARALYTAHSLRHSRAVDLLEKSNFDIWSVADILGHSSIHSTLCYLQVCPSVQRHMREIMNR